MTPVVTVPPTRCAERLRRWAREIALIVMDRIRKGQGTHGIWAFGRDVYFGPISQGIPQRATLIGVYNDRASLRAMTDDIEAILTTEPIHAVA